MKLKLAVLFGGKSTEHEISIISAIQAIGYIDRNKFEVIPIYVTKKNELYIGKDIDKIERYKKIPELLKESKRVCLTNKDNKVYIVNADGLVKKPINTIDVAFPIVHGTNVEDGTIQGYLRMFNLPIVGCDVTSSAVGMDKYVMKAVLDYNDIPVLPCLRLNAKDFNANQDEVVDSISKKLDYPVIVKPVNLGSSVGISKADDREALVTALELAFSFAEKVIVERAITNLKEINCSVLGDEYGAEASECEQPLNAHEILSYTDKYMGNGAKNGAKSSGSKGMASLSRKIPADISDDTRTAIREMAVKAFMCLGCSGVSRIDFMIDMDDNKVYLNEINTIPGSLSFYLWEPLGVSYSSLLERMIKIALIKTRREENLVFSFETNVLDNASVHGQKGSKGSKA